jgi:ABC-type iron transport system FetAB permease component
MTPTINMLSIAGLISIPGMMTGQILAGGDPVVAAKYQVCILSVLHPVNPGTVGTPVSCRCARVLLLSAVSISLDGC